MKASQSPVEQPVKKSINDYVEIDSRRYFSGYVGVHKKMIMLLLWDEALTLQQATQELFYKPSELLTAWKHLHRCGFLNAPHSERLELIPERTPQLLLYLTTELTFRQAFRLTLEQCQELAREELEASTFPELRSYL